MQVDKVPNVITVCCILHNICEIHGDTFDTAWLEELENTNSLTQPTAPTQNDNVQTGTPYAVRDALVKFVNVSYSSN